MFAVSSSALDAIAWHRQVNGARRRATSSPIPPTGINIAFDATQPPRGPGARLLPESGRAPGRVPGAQISASIKVTRVSPRAARRGWRRDPATTMRIRIRSHRASGAAAVLVTFWLGYFWKAAPSRVATIHAGFTALLPEMMLGLLAILLVVRPSRRAHISRSPISSPLVALRAPLSGLISCRCGPCAIHLAIAAGVFASRFRLYAGLWARRRQAGGGADAVVLARLDSQVPGADVAGRRRPDAGRGRVSPDARADRPTRDSLWRCNRFWRSRHSHPTVS